MTIGPEPITQIEWRSSLRGMSELLHELVDGVARVVRARPGLRVELERAGAQLRERKPFHRAVVERHVRRLEAVGRLDGEPVVLSRHEDPAGRALEHGMV